MGYTRYKALVHVKRGMETEYFKAENELYVDQCVADSDEAAEAMFKAQVPNGWTLVKIQTFGSSGQHQWTTSYMLSHPSRDQVARR